VGRGRGRGRETQADSLMIVRLHTQCGTGRRAQFQDPEIMT